jgi:ATP-binding cassette, subfamily G (WHITE), member 2
MDIFVKERHIFVRETGSKYHLALSYFVTKTVLDMFALRIIPVTVFVFIFYWFMGLRSEPAAFIIFWATLVLFNVCAGVMSICISIATQTVGQANLIASVWFLIMLLFGGFLVNVQSMDPWYAWLKYVSIFYYSFELLMTNELTGLLLSFDAPGYPALPVYGEVFLATIGMDVNNQLRNLICLCSLALGFSLAAYLLLLLRVPTAAGKHFQRMQNENKRLARKMSKHSNEDEREEGEDVNSPGSAPSSS